MADRPFGLRTRQTNPFADAITKAFRDKDRSGRRGKLEDRSRYKPRQDVPKAHRRRPAVPARPLAHALAPAGRKGRGKGRRR